MGKFYGLSQHINNEIQIIMEKKFGYRQWRLSLSDNIQCEPVDVYYTITIMVKLEPLNLKPHNNTMSNQQISYYSFGDKQIFLGKEKSNFYSKPKVQLPNYPTELFRLEAYDDTNYQ